MRNVGSDKDKFAFMVEAALEGGADRAGLIEVNRIAVDKRVRLKCQVPICKDYNHNLMCPPNVFSVDEAKELLSQYNWALLVQVRSKGISEKEITQAELQVQRLISELETKALMNGNYFTAGFGASSCKLCPECVGVASGKKCLHPYQARPSMEAVGMDIYQTCQNADLPINPLDQENLYFAGLLLIT